MSFSIPGDGASPCTLFIVGERPGREERLAGYGFVGPAGRELWSRLARIVGVTRDACWVTNLVKTPDFGPPTREEIARDAPILVAELLRVRPSLIVTVGYHAARWFLPQFLDVAGDAFHGLPFLYQYGRLTPRRAVVVPVVHSAAALRSPDRYQEQLTADLRAVAGVRAALADHDEDPARLTLHHAAPLTPFQIGLASFGKEGQRLGLDTEGTVAVPECVSLAPDLRHAACIETPNPTVPPQFLRPSIQTARRLVIHHAKYDMAVLHRLGCHDLPPVDDTMLAAFHLGEPQSLKVLAFRLCGYRMLDYTDLVTPLDNARVRATLETQYAHLSSRLASAVVQSLDRARSVRQSDAPRTRRRSGQPHAPTKAAYAKAAAQIRTVDGVPKRALTSLRQILALGGGGRDEAAPDSVVDEGGADRAGGQKALRARWAGSVFAPHIPLPAPVTWRDTPKGDRIPYAMSDAVAHLAVDTVLQPRLRAEGVLQAYRIDKSILPFLVRNELVGLAVDERGLRALSTEFAADYDRVCKKINRLAGHDLNPASWPQVGETLFDELEITPTRRTRTGGWTTADKYLKARKGEHAIVPLVLEARQISKMRGTYVDKLPSMLVDGRYHPDWKYTRTISGRPAEEIILLIPKHSVRGKQIRECFHESRGGLVSCDLSQIEMRVMAHESQDKLFLKAYRTGLDMHAQTAHELLGAPKSRDAQDESKHRLPSKTINFGILMGMTEYGLLDQLHENGLLHWTLDTVTEFRDEWFRLYPGVARWIEEKKQEAHRDGFVRDMWGAKIRLSGIWIHEDVDGRNDRVRAEFERRAHAVPIQSGAIRIAKRWIARVERELLRPTYGTRAAIEPWVWMHDDITVDGPRRLRYSIAERMCALVPQDLCVPVTADAKAGRTWGEIADKHRAETLRSAA